MNIEVYSICYNEEFLMPLFLDHYFNHLNVSKFIFYDNQSTDKTVEIATNFKKCPVEIISYDSNNKLNDQIYLDIKNNAWKNSTADWVIVCDMDEFIIINDTSILNNLNPVVYKCYGYQMISDKLPNYDSLLINQIKDGAYDNNYSKCSLFKPTINEINYLPGSHSCNPSHQIVQPPSLLLLHYKFFSLDYVINNYKLRAERLSKLNKIKGYGIHYNFDIEEIKRIYNNINENKRKILP